MRATCPPVSPLHVTERNTLFLLTLIFFSYDRAEGATKASVSSGQSSDQYPKGHKHTHNIRIIK